RAAEITGISRRRSGYLFEALRYLFKGRGQLRTILRESQVRQIIGTFLDRRVPIQRDIDRLVQEGVVGEVRQWLRLRWSEIKWGDLDELVDIRKRLCFDYLMCHRQ